MTRGINIWPGLLEGGPAGSLDHAYLTSLATAGFEGVRFMVDPAPVLTGAIPGSTLGWKAQMAAWACIAAGLPNSTVCLAPQNQDAICNDPTAFRAYRIMAREVVHRMQAVGVPVSVAVELMNEPQSWDHAEAWGLLQNRLYLDCRQQDSSRPLIVSGPKSSWVEGLASFDARSYAADPLCRVAIHFYGFGNVSFTHQRAPWVADLADAPYTPWPARAGAVAAELGRVSTWAAGAGLPPGRIVVNEFGAYRRTNGTGARDCDVAQFLSDVRAACKALGFSWMVYADEPRPFSSAGTFALRKRDGSMAFQPEFLTALGLID